MNKTEIGTLITELQEKELSQPVFYESMSWDEYVAATEKAVGNDEELKSLLRLKHQEDSIAQVTLEKLITSSFEMAKSTIDQMTLVKRIELLDELQTYRSHLYSMCDRYGNPDYSREDQPTAKEFRVLMGRIKHLEILQNWLFGIM